MHSAPPEPPIIHEPEIDSALFAATERLLAHIVDARTAGPQQPSASIGHIVIPKEKESEFFKSFKEMNACSTVVIRKNQAILREEKGDVIFYESESKTANRKTARNSFEYVFTFECK